MRPAERDGLALERHRGAGERPLGHHQLRGGATALPRTLRLLRAPVAEISADPIASAATLRAGTGATALLKGAATVIAGEEEITLNTTGCSGMATGGSGDVLTGLIAGLCAQGMPAYEAASAGAWLHGRAGELCARRFGQRAMTAADLLSFLPGALAEAERENPVMISQTE